jgi:hypothetical protein
MKPFNRKVSFAAIITIILLVALASPALAITITIDGSRESAWDGGGTQSDPNEAAVSNDGVDLARVQWTNDLTNMYFLFETYTNTYWSQFPFRPYILLCMNTDNSTATGSTFPGVCPGSGYDRYIWIEGQGSFPPLVTVYSSTFGIIGATTSVATSGVYTELSIDNASLGFSSTNCGLSSTSVYIDGRTSDPDDNVRDTEDIPLTCGGPTAVTLSSFSAGAQRPVGITVLSVVLLVGALAGLGILRRRKQA